MSQGSSGRRIGPQERRGVYRDGLSPFKGGVAIADGKIVACGDDLHLALRSSGPIPTCAGRFGDRLIMPGIIDSIYAFRASAMTTDPTSASTSSTARVSSR